MKSKHGSEALSDDSRTILATKLAQSIEGKAFSELADVTFEHRGAMLVGKVLIESLQQRGYGLSDFDAVGALTSAAVPIVDAIIHAANAQGAALNAFVMDFVYPSIKGPSIAGERVLLVDSWLSEKSYIQTSSLVTLRDGNELGLDFGIIAKEGATVVAIASLIGSRRQFEHSPKSESSSQTFTIEAVNPTTQERAQIPFVMVFDEDALRLMSPADAATTAESEPAESEHGTKDVQA
ncbi:orotate phosphoribosyltransferase [Bifidobacterium aquikefiricola]|uniref:Orotate phosphoribosyltransferase n=1 Tax=Bifidobacterium aquikefiricola TaxID=3059038 RepID=A0AB39U608_9BIFI